MTPAEVETVLSTARSYWLGGLFGLPFAELLDTWTPVLEPFARSDVEQALSEMLAAGRTEFPPLPVLLGAMAEQRRLQQARMASEKLHGPRLQPGERSVSQAVADFDKSAADMRSAEKAQASQIMRDTGKDEHWLMQRFAEIDVVGPFEQRARRLMAGEVAPEELGTWWPEEPRQRKGGAESVGAILSRPSPEKPPEPAPEPEPSATDRVMGAELAQRFLAGEKVDVSKLSAGLRRAAREAVIASRAAKATA